MAFNKDKRLELEEDTIVFDNPNFDNSIIGITTDGKAVYDYYKMVAELMEDDKISEEEAIDFIDYNTIRAIPYAGEMAPVIIIPLEEGLYVKQ